MKEVNRPLGYEVIVDHETTPGMILVTNKHEPEDVNLKGKKTWDDDNDRDRKRPERIKVNLLADGEKIQEKFVTAKDDWAYEFKDLPKYKEGGTEIIYTITEDSVPNYTTDIEGPNITNKYTPGKTSATVTKTWDDQNDKEGKRAKSIRVQLYANGKKEGTQVTLNEGNKWTHTWTDLNENANGKPIKYTVKEVGSVDGYEVAVDNGNKGNLVITNTFIEEIPPFDDSGNEDDGVDGPSFEGGGFNKPNLSTPDFSEDTKLGLYESGDNTPNKAQKGDLPKTGEQTNPWYIVAGIILCLLAIFFIFRNRRHKKQNR